MIDKVESAEKLKESLVDVRKAHRLLKEYQERTLNLIFYIKEKYSMPFVTGKRRFCRPLRSKRNEYIEIWKDMWSWDFLYSYEFEYYFGEVDLGEDRKYALSILQVSDTGFYIKENADGNDITTFETAENSETAFVFIFEMNSKSENWYWSEKFDDAKRHLFNKKIRPYQIDNKFIAISYSLDKFLNQENTNSVLKEFSEKVYNMCGVTLYKNNKA